MTANASPKTLVLPAEIMAREFDARLLQGVLALDRGWQVIVGSKALINRAIWRLPASVYLCQTLTHKRVAMLALLKRLGHTCYGWDEEGLIYYDADIYLMRRVSSDTLAHLAGLVSWGPQSAQDIAQRAGTAGLTPLALGNPRFDLLRPELRKAHSGQVDALKRQYGDFILINTNFPSLNPIISLHNTPVRKMSPKDQASGEAQKRFDKIQLDRCRIYDAFREMLKPLADRFPQTTIIVRPHPAEEISSWREAARAQTNIKVVRQGDSVPWLAAASALIHNGCTTAVEAAMTGQTPIAYCPGGPTDLESRLPNAISHRTDTMEALYTAVELAMSGKLAMTDEQNSVFDLYVSGRKGPLAVHAILDLCDRLHHSGAGHRPPVFERVCARGFALLRHAYKSLRIGHRTDRYISKVFADRSAQDVTDRANLMGDALDLPFKVEARLLSRNIFQLTKA